MKKSICIFFLVTSILFGQSPSFKYGNYSKNKKSITFNKQSLLLESTETINANTLNLISFNKYILDQNKKKKKDNTVIAGVLGFIAGGLVYEAILNAGEGKMNVSSEYPDAKVHDSGSVGQHIAGWVLVGGLGALVGILIAS